jgi:hypothetical protein
VQTVRRPAGRAFQDPFDDAGRSARTPALAAITGDDLPGVNLPGDSLPGDNVPGIDVPADNLPAADLPEGPPVEPAANDLRLDFPFQQLPGALPEMDFDQLQVPTLDRPLLQDETEPVEKCPLPYDPDYHKKISELSTDITAEEGEFPRECRLTEETIQPFAVGHVRQNGLGQIWAPTTFTWKASALCHKPLYFEEVHLERYGHSWGPYLQPFASGAHFFLTVPALPYAMGLCPPCECIYTLGYYRPGSCAPRMLDPLPLSIRAGLAEAGVWTGMVFLIP